MTQKGSSELLYGLSICVLTLVTTPRGLYSSMVHRKDVLRRSAVAHAQAQAQVRNVDTYALRHGRGRSNVGAGLLGGLGTVEEEDNRANLRCGAIGPSVTSPFVTFHHCLKHTQKALTHMQIFVHGSLSALVAKTPTELDFMWTTQS